MNRSISIDGGSITMMMLTITFVVLKALGYLDWPWWLVFIPLWGPIALVLLIAAVIGVVAFCISLRRALKERRA